MSVSRPPRSSSGSSPHASAYTEHGGGCASRVEATTRRLPKRSRFRFFFPVDESVADFANPSSPFAPPLGLRLTTRTTRVDVARATAPPSARTNDASDSDSESESSASGDVVVVPGRRAPAGASATHRTPRPPPRRRARRRTTDERRNHRSVPSPRALFFRSRARESVGDRLVASRRPVVSPPPPNVREISRAAAVARRENDPPNPRGAARTRTSRPAPRRAPRSAVSRSFALALALVPGVHGLEFAPHGVERGEGVPRSGPVGELGVVGDAREGDQGAERVEVARVAGFEDGAELAERRDDGVRVRRASRAAAFSAAVGGARLRAREELEERRAAEVRGDGAVIHRARRREGRDEGVRAVPVAVEDEAAQERELGAEPIGRRGAPSRGKERDGRGERRGVRRRRGRRGRGGASSARGGGGRARGRVRARAPGLRLERPERVRQPRVLEKIKQHRHDVLAPSRRGTRGGHRPADARGGARAAAGNEWTGGR